MLQGRAAVGLVALLLLVGGRAEAAAAAGAPVRLGAALSLTGSLSREGILTREGYELCVDVVNGKGGIPIGGERHPLEIAYQDDTSKPDTAAALVDQFNDSGRKFILGPYGSASTEAAAAVVERNGQVMLDSAGADDKIFTKGYRRTFAVLSPASLYLASIVRAVAELARPKPETVAIISADDGFVLAGTVGTFVPPDAGRYTLFSFVVAVLGGLGNMWGALAGGLLLGVVTALLGQYISPTLVNAAAFGVLLAVLAVRPSGLVGRPFYDRRVEAA